MLKFRFLRKKWSINFGSYKKVCTFVALRNWEAETRHTTQYAY